MNDFCIGNRYIGPSHIPLVIAEIGINHNGSLELAKLLVDSAFEAGVEVIKHQTHVVDDEMSDLAKNVKPGNSNKSIYEIIKNAALSEKDEFDLMEYVNKKGLQFISTPFSRKAAFRLKEFDIPAFKIGSGECNNFPLLELISSFGKPVILSTGMNGFDVIDEAVCIFNRHNIPYSLLHTTNLYPTPNHLVRLGAMEQLINRYENVPIGLSDHTTSNHACFGAVALGASILERHYIDNKSLRTGPDVICSMDEQECKELIEGTHILFQQRGGEKKPALEEQVTIDFAFASIHSITPIKKGEVLNEDNIWVKRPGKGGILAKEYSELIGRTALRDIPENQQIQWSDVGE